MRLIKTRELKVEHAAWILNLSVRQVQRLKKRHDVRGGDDWDRHGNVGRTPANATGNGLRQQILELAGSVYKGLNDTQIHRELQQNHGIELSRQTVRRILRAGGVPSVNGRQSKAEKTEPGESDDGGPAQVMKQAAGS
ncbi:MAG: hypothetical protein R2729_23545 [Bryobacteraceae bacterium]